MLAEAAARQVKVVMNGEGSDELFGGYLQFRRQRSVQPLSRLPLGLRRLVVHFGQRLYGRLRRTHVQDLILLPPVMDMRRYAALHGVPSSQLCLELLSPAMRAALADSDENAPPIPPPTEFESWQTFQQQQYLEQTVRLPDWINSALDRASMAHGLEVRVPFLDHELAEFCARIPVGLKLHGRTEKFILRRALRGILPKSILDRRKRAFASPGSSWWRRDRLPDFAAAQMNEGALRRKGLFEPAAVHELLSRHRRGEGHYARQLEAVLGMQLRYDLLQPSRLRAESSQAGSRPTPTGAQ